MIGKIVCEYNWKSSSIGYLPILLGITVMEGKTIYNGYAVHLELGIHSTMPPTVYNFVAVMDFIVNYNKTIN